MTKEAEQVKEFMVAAGQIPPDAPAIPPIAIRILRARLILEEALETIFEGLGIVVETALDHEVCMANVVFLENSPGNLEQIADGCADMKVVTIGTELACGIDGEPVFAEVMRSNMTKDFSPREAGKKVTKGPNYEPPNIESILVEQGVRACVK